MITRTLHKNFLKGHKLVQNSLSLNNSLSRYFTVIQGFKLPDLGEKIKEATVNKWHVKVGDIVEELDTLADVSTDKLFTPLPAPYPGKIHKIYVDADNECEVGSVLVEIEISDETAAELGLEGFEAGEEETSSEAKDDKTVETQKSTGSQTQKSGQTVYQELDDVLSTPAVRALAKRQNVDMRFVKGSQKNGRIIKDDIHAYLEGKMATETTEKKSPRVNYENLDGQQAKKPSPTELITHTTVESLNVPHGMSFPGMTRQSMTPMEIGMVKAMTYNTTVPQFFSMEEVLVGKLLAWRAELNQGRTGEDRLSVMPFFIKAYSMALKYYPRINSLYYPERPYEFEQHGEHNISVAIDSKYGLIAPNIKNVAYKSLIEIDQDLKRLRKLADEGHVGSDELFGGTSAITNIGSIAGTYAGPVNMPNQVFISALGKMKDEPVFVNPVKTDDGRTLYEVEMQKKLYLSCGCDHRVLDGATVARFLIKWKYFMENPDAWVLEMK